MGQRRLARGFKRQVAALKVRLAVLNGFTTPGIPDVADVAGEVHPATG
jgi:hypothetical protein